MRDTTKIVLSEPQLKWIRKHFKHTKNDDIMSRLCISHSTLHRIARELGLKKSAQFVRKCQANATQHAHAANRRNNWPPNGYIIPRSREFCFKQGVRPVERLGAQVNAIRIKKAHETRNRTIASEKRRILFGLEQKTKMKLVAAPHAKAAYRYVLKKRGYYIERGGRTAYYDEKTDRSATVERTAFEKYRFEVKPKEAI